MRRAIELREYKRAQSATLISKMERGRQARKRFIRVKMEANRVRLTVAVQVGNQLYCFCCLCCYVVYVVMLLSCFMWSAAFEALIFFYHVL